MLVRTYSYGPYANVPICTGPAEPSRRVSQSVLLGRSGTAVRTFRRASTYWYLAIEAAALDDTPMKKRILASTLWFFAGWYGGAVLGWVLGIEAPIGLIVGIAAGGFVWVDPVHLLWNPSAARSRARLKATTAASAMPVFEAKRLS
jgi:hypothetical protein